MLRGQGVNRVNGQRSASQEGAVFDHNTKRVFNHVWCGFFMFNVLDRVGYVVRRGPTRVLLHHPPARHRSRHTMNEGVIPMTMETRCCKFFFPKTQNTASVEDTHVPLMS